MTANSPWYFYAIYIILGMGGIGGLAQLVHAWVARKKQRPEIDSIIATGARNAVESLQVALVASNSALAAMGKELKEAKGHLAEVEAHYEAEIEQLVATIGALREGLDAAEDRARGLAAELAEARTKRSESG